MASDIDDLDALLMDEGQESAAELQTDEAQGVAQAVSEQTGADPAEMLLGELTDVLRRLGIPEGKELPQLVVLRRSVHPGTLDDAAYAAALVRIQLADAYEGLESDRVPLRTKIADEMIAAAVLGGSKLSKDDAKARAEEDPRYLEHVARVEHARKGHQLAELIRDSMVRRFWLFARNGRGATEA